LSAYAYQKGVSLVPAGTWIPARTAAEKNLVARIVARMRADGMLLPGAPDLVLAWRDGAALVELKRPKSRDLFGHVLPAGRPSAAQTELAERAARLGVRHAYVTSWDDLRTRLGDWGLHDQQYQQ
jgi:hypothetical protein